jgi:long-chain fatty acid transport protein
MTTRASALRLAVAAVAAACVAIGAPRTARAGGFELPDNGTQALGRGAAFVAKADDPTAIYWNPAGLARQRGTRLLANANVDFHSFSFQRIGTFPDDPNDPATPWGGQPYPLAKNTAGPFVAPFLAMTSDFGAFDRLTFAIGAFGPPVIGNRTFPLGVSGAPASTRYDFVQSRSTILMPTASAAFRVTPWLDVGVSGHLVVAKIDQTQVSYSEAVAGQCANVEYQPCDSRGTFVGSATALAGTFGVMLRPQASLALGASVRTPIGLTAAGTLTPQSPRIADVELAPGAATLYTNLPLEVKLGGRWVAMDRDFELYDLELDATYEAWGAAQGTGPRTQIPDLGTFKLIDATVTHRYNDTFGVRAGGAYNLEAWDGLVSLRAGAYFDSPATDFAYTRVDYDTLAKIAGTIGFGYRYGAFGFDLAYAMVASVPRVVGSGQGDVRPINGAKGGRTVDANDDPLPAVNEGAFRGFTHILSLGATVTFDAFFGPPRPVHFGNPYEPGFVPGEAKGTKKRGEKGDEGDEGSEKGGDEATPSSDERPSSEEPPADDKKKEEKKKEWWEELD